MAKAKSQPKERKVQEAAEEFGNPTFLKSLRFQTLALNLGMLVMFILTAVIVASSLSGMTEQAENVSYNISEVLKYEGEAKETVQEIYGDAAVISLNAENMTKAEIADWQSSQDEYAANITSNMGSMEELLNNMGLTDALAEAQTLESAMDTYVSAAQAVYDAAAAGNFDKTEGMMDDIESGIEAVDAQISVMDQKLDEAIAGIRPALEQREHSAMRRVIIVMVLFIIVLVLNILLTYMRINKKITAASDEIQVMIDKIKAGRGDLTARIRTRSDTELYHIIHGVNEFIENLQGILREVKDGTVVLEDSSSSITSKIQKASDSVTNTSAALEELSASMQNVSTTAEIINDKLDDVRRATQEIDDEAESGAERAKQIQVEADTIKTDAGKKKDSTGVKMQELSEVLGQSVKDSEKVKQIGDLTNEILSIASQTNLLALNASIEAARAGEAGKGFAVVAEEISELAANSRDTAGNIQLISEDVTKAVKTLSDNAMEVMDFINTTVLADYDAFVETGEKYENTADIIEEMLDNFKAKADNLNEIMDEMADGVSSITSSVQESTSAIGMSAENSTEIVSEINGISEAMDENNRVADQLSASAARFEHM